MYCKKCGKEIRDDSQFCAICGANQGNMQKESEAKTEGAFNFLETFLAKAGSMPGVRVDREEFLKKAFGRGHLQKHIDRIVLNGPLAAGLSVETVGKIADAAIRAEAAKTITISAATGAPGGPLGWAMIPADITQFYIHLE